MTCKSDKELIAGCLSGKPLAQRDLFEKYRHDLLRVCRRYARDDDDAMEIMQNGFIKVFTRFDSYNGQGNLRAWLHSIMVRTAIDHYRKSQRELRVISHEEYLQEEPTPALVEMDMAAEDILLVIRGLGSTYRTIFNMFALDGMSHKDIAAELNISESTSKWYLCEARKQIRKKLALLDSSVRKYHVA